MPNGYRRGGTYRRNGKTFRRKGAKIKHPVALYAVAGTAVFATWAVGGPIIASPVALGAVLAVGVGVLVWRHRKRAARVLKPVGRKMEGWAAARHVTRRTPDVFTRRGLAPKHVPSASMPSRQLKRSGAYLDAQLRPHSRDGKFIPVQEWEDLYNGRSGK